MADQNVRRIRSTTILIVHITDLFHNMCNNIKNTVIYVCNVLYRTQNVIYNAKIF